MIKLKQNIMPYRRLPNTDKARIRAMRRAIELGEKLTPSSLAYSSRLYSKLKSFLPIFEHAILLQKESTEKQVQKNSNYIESLNKARIYISHFIQVFNFAIVRGEIKPESRRFYMLDVTNSKLPPLASESAVIEWGQNIIAGESARVKVGETPMTNPRIALVKVHYDAFLEKYQYQKMLKSISIRANKKVAELRPEADELITKLWNEIEASFDHYESAVKRSQAANYGVVYVTRKVERLEEHKLAV